MKKILFMLSFVFSLASFAADKPALPSPDTRCVQDFLGYGWDCHGIFKRDRLICNAVGEGGREATLTLDGGKDGRKKRFKAQWQIDVGAGQLPGDIVKVSIEDTFIGLIILDEVDGETLEGAFNLNNKKFPPDFPLVLVGTRANVGDLTCQFEEG